MVTLEVGKTYKTSNGRLVEIILHDPEWGGGMFWGNSIDNIEPVLNHERWTPDTRWWSYVKMFGGMQLRDEKLNFIEEVIK
jgi:hypothetical protein